MQYYIDVIDFNQESHKLRAISVCYEIHFLKRRLMEMKLKTEEQVNTLIG